MTTMTSATIDETGAPTQPAPWHDGVALGLVLTVAGALGLMAVFGEIFFDALAFLVVFIALAVWAARSRSSRLRWAIAVLMTLFVGVNSVYAVGDLSHPESPGPFIATAVVIASGIATIVLAVATARGRQLSARRTWSIVAVVVGVAAVGSMLATAATDDAVAQPGDATIVAERVDYPEQVVVTSGASGVLLSNHDNMRHNFVVDGQIDEVELPANTDVRVDIADLAPGEYAFHCSIPGHEAMQGSLVIE